MAAAGPAAFSSSLCSPLGAWLCQPEVNTFSSSIFHIVASSVPDLPEQEDQGTVKAALINSSQLIKLPREPVGQTGLGPFSGPRLSVSTGFNQAGIKMLLSLPYGQTFSIGECHCGPIGTSLRASPLSFLRKSHPMLGQGCCKATQPPPAS